MCFDIVLNGMVTIKDNKALEKMAYAGSVIAELFEELSTFITPGITTHLIDQKIDVTLKEKGLVSATKGYKGYRHASCISVNDEIVHGVPKETHVIKDGDLVSVDICASWKGYCADAARTYVIGTVSPLAISLKNVAQEALINGIDQARVGNRLSDISSAIQKTVERYGFSVVREFAGHGIGKHMHEEPDILNYGPPGKGILLKEGMTFAIEPMICAGSCRVRIDKDGWTARTADGKLAAHVEETVAITKDGPVVLTKRSYNKDVVAKDQG